MMGEIFASRRRKEAVVTRSPKTGSATVRSEWPYVIMVVLGMLAWVFVGGDRSSRSTPRL